MAVTKPETGYDLLIRALDLDESQVRELAVDRLLSCLSPLQEEVMRMRFGIGADWGPHTAEEVAHVLLREPETVRQEEARALYAMVQVTSR